MCLSVLIYFLFDYYFVPLLVILEMCYRCGIHEPTDSKDVMLLMFELKFCWHTHPHPEEGESKYNRQLSERTIHNANNGRFMHTERAIIHTESELDLAS